MNAEEAENVRREWVTPGLRVTAIPNCVPDPLVAPSDCSHKTVIAAGRLVKDKQFASLIRSFATVVGQRPDWQLRIFGRGPLRGELKTLVGELGLCDNVLLMGATRRLEMEWAKASIMAFSSVREALPMAIIEAMRAGLPVVSTDCDYGPRETITHGVDGLLVPVGDADGLADGILTLVNDAERRQAMGRAAERNSARFSPQVVADQYESFFRELQEARNLPTTVDWWAMPHGDLVFRLNSATSFSGLRLLCASREDSQSELSFAFQQTNLDDDPDGSLTAVIPRSALPEGEWDLFMASADGLLCRRLRTGTGDNRYLMDATGPSLDGPALQVHIPLVDEDRALSIRSWRREVHAEAVSVGNARGEISVEAELWGATLSDSAEVLAAGRAHEELSFRVPLSALSDTRFRFSIPCSTVAQRRVTEHDIWDVYVTPAEGATPIRIGRFTGDYIHKKSVHDYPFTVLESTPRGRSRVRPFFSVDSELSLNAVDMSK
ncbi:glycosyltransferase [Streptoverticillium reticulum]|uniref:glycosyltransferase n=1 Tax=Streptoverticillium reticulum TaxID=1433415 RepID=UPI0039BFFE4E